jgi:hypothetical protein
MIRLPRLFLANNVGRLGWVFVIFLAVLFSNNYFICANYESRTSLTALSPPLVSPSTISPRALSSSSFSVSSSAASLSACAAVAEREMDFLRESVIKELQEVLLHELEAQMFKADCRKDLFLQLPLQGLTWMKNGFALQMGMTISLLSYLLSVRNGHVIHQDPEKFAFSSTNECDKGWECFLLPLSNCQNFNFKGSKRLKPTILTPKNTPHLKMGFPFRHPMPNRYSEMGPLEYYSVMTRFVFRPQPSVALQLKRAVDEVDWSNKMIAMYARLHYNVSMEETKLSDGVRGALKEQGFDHYTRLKFSNYMAVAEQMRRRFGVAHILLASDDPTALEESKRDKYKHWRFLRQPMSDNDSSSSKDVLQVLRQMDLLSRANYLVGPMTSPFFRTVYQLGRSRGNFLRAGTMHSIDIGWFADP